SERPRPQAARRPRPKAEEPVMQNGRAVPPTGSASASGGRGPAGRDQADEFPAGSAGRSFGRGGWQYGQAEQAQGRESAGPRQSRQGQRGQSQLRQRQQAQA